MINPFVKLDRKILRKSLANGQMFFVRQTYRGGETPGVKPGNSVLLTGYKGEEEAKEHFDRLEQDGRRFLYDARDTAHLRRLETAALGVPGFAVYVPLVEGPVTPGKELQGKLKNYISRRLQWRVKREIGVEADIRVRFGEIIVTLSYDGAVAEVPLAEIE
jgi:hypothetical protein